MDKTIENERLGQPASHIIVVPETRRRVWDVIADPESLAKYHPFCERDEIERWPGVGSRDTIYYYSGAVFERQFTGWDEGRGYDLLGTMEDGTTFRVSWRIEAVGPVGSSLTITIWPIIPPGSEDRSRQISRLLTRYLKQVGEGLQHYLRTGQPVSRNQFGSHRLFSPPF